MNITFIYNGITTTFEPFSKEIVVVDMNNDSRIITLNDGKNVTFEAFNDLLKKGLLQIK